MKSNKIKESPEFIVDIESLTHEGRGVTRINEKASFISGALPNEKVKCKLSKRHSRYNEGETLEVINAAPERVTPGCAHFNICGGCSLQHMDNTAQVLFKQGVLLEQLKHFGGITPEQILAPISGNPWGYRRKARLGVRYVRKKERVLVGFREKFSHYLAEIDQCPVLHPSVGLHIKDLSALIASLEQYEHIAQIEVAVSEHASALVFRHMMPLPSSDIDKLIEFGKKFNFTLYLQPNPPAEIHKIWPNNADKLTYSLPDFSLEMQFEPLDFTQINGEINQLMLQKAINLLAPTATDKVLDLFCGLGNFTLPIARQAKLAIGIEGGAAMVARAGDNAKHNNILNAEFYAANLTSPDPAQAWMKNKYDKILLDPPRSGALEIIQFFKQFDAKRIVYVSCNPATLARDAKELVQTQGYKLRASGIINMFPHTSHIEAMAVFEK